MHVLVLSPESLIQTALTHLLSRDAEFRVTAADSLAAADREHDLRDLSVVMVDAGRETSRRDEIDILARHCPDTPLIAIIAPGCHNSTSHMFAVGAKGVVSRDASAAEFISAVREVCAGHVYASRSVTRAMRDLITTQAPSAPPRGQIVWGRDLLSEREHAVVDLLTRGMTNSEIAGSLHLAEATVKAHLSHVMTKWSVRDRTQVVLRALGVAIAGSEMA